MDAFLIGFAFGLFVGVVFWPIRRMELPKYRVYKIPPGLPIYGEPGEADVVSINAPPRVDY